VGIAFLIFIAPIAAPIFFYNPHPRYIMQHSAFFLILICNHHAKLLIRMSKEICCLGRGNRLWTFFIDSSWGLHDSSLFKNKFFSARFHLTNSF